jgi:hypothetical protein
MARYEGEVEAFVFLSAAMMAWTKVCMAKSRAEPSVRQRACPKPKPSRSRARPPTRRTPSKKIKRAKEDAA